MPTIPGSVRVGGFIAPSLTSDPYATHDDQYGKGGFRAVADLTARDAITAERRVEGMWVKVLSEDKVYTLSGGITNGDWLEQTMGGAAINAPLTMYVDGTDGDDGDDGLTWGTAKKTFGFLIGTATDALPKEINAAFTCYFRNDIRARDADGHFLIRGFYGSGSMTFIGTLTAVETLTATTYENDGAVRHGRIWVNDATKAWTPGQYRRHFIKVGADPNYYPIYANTETKLYFPVGASLTGTPACTIYSAPELLEELESDPGVKHNFGAWPGIFFAVRSCVVQVDVSNLWLDEVASWYDSTNLMDSPRINLTNIAMSCSLTTNVGFLNYTGCYFDLWDYRYNLDEYTSAWVWSCVIDSTDNTGWGYNPWEHSNAFFSNTIFVNQEVGLYAFDYGIANLLGDVVFRYCEVGVLFGGSTLSFVGGYLLGVDLRFDTVTTCMEANGTVILRDGHETAVWDVGSEIVIGETDYAEFSEVTAGTLQSRVGLSVFTMDADTTLIFKDEYDNTTSGLTAVRYQTAIDELASSGGAPQTPEFSLSSPRAIVDGDHNGELLAAAIVGGGFIYTIGHAVTPGTIVRIGCLGYTLKVTCGADTIILGSGAFSAGIVGLGFTDAGAYVDLIYIGEITAGTWGWGIIGGSGVATEVDGGGAFTTVKFAFNGLGSYVATLGETAIDLVDDTDFTAVEASPYVTEGMGYGLVVTPTTGTGNLTVVLYQDVARTEPVYTMVVDLSDANTFRSAEPFGFALETAGTLYGTAFVSGVGASETFDIAITALGLQPTVAPAALPSPYGDGIEDDGLGKPRVALPSDGGLQFATGKLKLKPDITAAVYPTLSAAGIAIANAVTTTTDEVVAAKKMFDAVGCTPLAGSGPPAAGTYETGQEVLDTNGIKYRCTGAGTPGTWELADSVGDASADYATASLIPGEVETLEILTTGDVGTFQLLQVWAVVADPDNYSTDFRLRIYRTSDGYGREVMWQASGISRQSFLTAILPAAQDYVEVDDEDMFETDDACVIYEDANRYELARILARSTGNMDLDEVLVDGSSWAADTLVCDVAEFENVPFRNEDGTPSNRGRAFLQVRNNHPTNSAIFYVRALPMSLGVLR